LPGYPHVATSRRFPARLTSAMAVAFAASLTLAACGGHGDAPEEKEGGASRQTVSATTAISVALPRTVVASGTVSAWEEVPVGAETGGLTAIALYVDEGSYVRQGQPLVQMNDVLLKAQLQQQQAAVQTAAASVAREDADPSRSQEHEQLCIL